MKSTTNKTGARRGNTFGSRICPKAIAVTAIAACSGASMAQDGSAQFQDSDRRQDVTVRLGAGHSDNLFQTSVLEESGNYRLLGVDVDFYRETTRVETEVTGDVEFRSYSHPAIDDAPYGSFDAQVEIQAIRDRLSWIVSDEYGEGRLDPFQMQGPGNREQINIFTTGPALYLPVGERTEIRLSSMLGNRSYEESKDFDADTLESTAGVYRQIGMTAEVGLVLSTRDVEFDTLDYDNTIERAAIRYDKTLSDGEASLQLGTNRVEYESYSKSSPMFEISWARQVGTRSRVQLQAQQALVDSSDTFRGGQTPDDALRSVDVYERTSAGAALNLGFPRGEMTFTGRIGEDRYENDLTLDNDLLQVGVAYERPLSNRLNLGISYFSVDREFQITDQQSDDTGTMIWAERAFGSKISLDIEYERSSRGGRGVDSSDENTIRLSVIYDLSRQNQ